MKRLNILVRFILIILLIFVGVKIMETVIKGFIATGEVNIGSEAIERGSSFGAPSTLINKDNPANASGKVTSVEIYPSLTGDLENCEIASFYRPNPVSNPNNFTTRDTYAIGAVTGGSKQTKTVDLDVEKDDYLGITFTAGSIEYSPTGSGYSGVWSKGGDYIPCTNASFFLTSGATISLKATNAVSSKCTIIDGSLLVNQTGEFAGKVIDGSLTVIRDKVGACLDTSQSLRMTITIDGEDVSDSIVGDIKITHNLNYISTFSLSLGDPKYSPKTDSHIAINKEIVITVFINGQEIKMFTGLIDRLYVNSDGGFRIDITGRDYGKKLLKKTMTLISVQESAEKALRGSMVKYLASQADITNINVPTGDAVTIDHSFQDQTIWDMIQKECAIEGWYVRFDENGVMHLKTKELKDTPDWEYGEDKFVQLGLDGTDEGIINKVIILGAIFEEEVITIETEDDAGNPITSSVVVPDSEYEDTDYSFSNSFSEGEVVEGWTDGDATIRVTASYIGFTKPPGYVFPTSQNYKFTISGSDSGKIKNLAYTVSGGATKISKGSNSVSIARDCTGMLPSFSQAAFSITITLSTKELAAGGSVWITENIPNETTTSTITYTQVKASVQDAASIALYGERKPNNEGTLEFPLAETPEQCKRIGGNIEIESHRFTEQPDFLVNFNPKLIVGDTVQLTDKKIGYDGDKYLVEEVIHTININSQTGAVKQRTRIGCVYYA